MNDDLTLYRIEYINAKRHIAEFRRYLFWNWFRSPRHPGEPVSLYYQSYGSTELFYVRPIVVHTSTRPNQVILAGTIVRDWRSGDQFIVVLNLDDNTGGIVFNPAG